jgi:hypothetical protein
VASLSLNKKESYIIPMPEPTTKEQQNAGYLTEAMYETEALDKKNEPYVPLQNQNPAQAMWELDASDLIDELRHTLKGHIKKPTGEWDEAQEYPLMNELGIREVVVIVGNAIANKNMFLSNLTEERCLLIIRDTRIAIVMMICYYSEAYGIERLKRDYIVTLLTAFVAAAVFRPMEGGERKGRWSTEIRKYVYGQMQRGDGTPQQKEKKGLFGIGHFGL